VFEPYVRVRPNLVGMTSAAMREVIRDVHHRIDQFVVGRAGVVPLIGEYKRLGGGEGWILAEVTHQSAREKMVSAGVRAAVELFGHSNGRHLYTVWRRSEYVVGFPVKAILAALNTAEGFAPEDPKGWGGAENVGGSPRVRGSALTPTEVEKVVAEVVATHST
jgi:hypothetical protein